MLLTFACGIVSCSGQDHRETLDRAEAVMEEHPDSAFCILKSIDKTTLGSRSERARYALLMSMALDKNYIDTTNFDVLQPAIDYYLKKGSPDEKLRTYYYQGRIYQNQGDRDRALNSFVKALENNSGYTDSLCMARTLVAQAFLYKDFYDFNSYSNSYLRAANIYKSKGLKEHESDCLFNALNGTIILKDKNRADSIFKILEQFEVVHNNRFNQTLKGYLLSKTLIFGTSQELKKLITEQTDSLYSNSNCILNLAAGYNKLGDYHKAEEILNMLKTMGIKYDTLKYQATYVSTLQALGKYKDAFSIYRDFSMRIDSINSYRFKQKAQSIEEKHKIELNAQKDARQKLKIIWGFVCGTVILLMGCVILILLISRHKNKKDLALHKAKAAELENERLISEKGILLLENKNLQLERDKKTLEAENLAHKVEILENESYMLKKLLDTPEEIPSEVQEAIQIRIEMLNSLLASYITDNDKYEKSYDNWVKELTDNKDEFMNSNRLAFQVSHPNFIKYFEDHNLTLDEINYVCLYAIGLRGKEVGNYMKKRSHVNISSAIRKKLGIDKHETNIGIYVRKLFKSL